MPSPQRKKRSYGYIANQKTRRPLCCKPFKKTKTWKKLFRRSGKSGKYNFKKAILLCILAFLIFGFLFATILIAWASKDLPDPDRLTDRQVAQSTKIYDRTGEHLLYEIFAKEKRTIIELEDVPQYVIDGVIATEDKKFYEHKGIRPLSILRAFVYGIFTKKRIAGTSTLTQQLVKNAILTDERSIMRKIKEAILSIRLEQKYTKKQILKIYFNEIPYGSTNYGIESAAQSYFGKHVSDLNMAESATLAGLPKAPSRYLNNPEAGKQRRDFVLRRMYEEGYITEKEKKEAQAEEYKIRQRYHNIEAPHFVLYVKEQLVEKYGETIVETGGLKVITTLDWDKQQIAERILGEEADDIFKKAQADNASLIALDPNTGQILSLVGSRDFFDDKIDGQFNVAILGKRQPGSSFKPIIYTSAFEKGYTPDTILFDTLTNFSVTGNPYQPQNYDLTEHGPLTMRQALQGSLNIPAVKTLYLVGNKDAIEFAKKLGYTTFKEDNFGLSLVLGGGEVKLIDHVGAFGVFANNGIKQERVSILKVEDSNGKILEEWKKKKGKKVLEPEIAATISNVLSDDEARAYMFGARGILTLPGRPVAAKTGTTNNYIDAWTIGYTPSLVAGIWVGNTDNTPMKRGFGGSRVAAPIWNKFMSEALANSPVESFPKAPANDAKKPVLRGSTGGMITLTVDKVTGKIATSSTPEKYLEKRTYIQPHSILHYVIKDDPRGDIPEDPTSDPQYLIWERGIKDWITRKQEEDPEWSINFEEPPTEHDDAHSLELIPTLEIVYPTEGQILTSRQIDTDIRVSAPRGVSKVIYRLDKMYIDVIHEHPFNLNYYANNIDPGEHTLTVIVEDDIKNRLEKEVKFLLKANPIPAGVSFSGNYEKLSIEDFPVSITLSHHKLNEIEKVRLYYKLETDDPILIDSTKDFSNLFNNQILLEWTTPPAPGNYILIAQVVMLGGEVRESDRVEISVN